MADDEYVTVVADELPEGSLSRRLAAFWPLHAEGEGCWCEPVVHSSGDITFIEHHIVASEGS